MKNPLIFIFTIFIPIFTSASQQNSKQNEDYKKAFDLLFTDLNPAESLKTLSKIHTSESHILQFFIKKRFFCDNSDFQKESNDQQIYLNHLVAGSSSPYFNLVYAHNSYFTTMFSSPYDLISANYLKIAESVHKKQKKISPLSERNDDFDLEHIVNLIYANDKKAEDLFIKNIKNGRIDPFMHEKELKILAKRGNGKAMGIVGEMYFYGSEEREKKNMNKLIPSLISTFQKNNYTNDYSTKNNSTKDSDDNISGSDNNNISGSDSNNITEENNKKEKNIKKEKKNEENIKNKEKNKNEEKNKNGKNNDITVEKCLNTAMHYFTEGTARKDPVSLNGMAKIYLENNDLKMAKKYFEEASKKGLSEADYNLFLFYSKYHSEDLGLGYLLSAANRGYMAAIYEYGLKMHKRHNYRNAILFLCGVCDYANEIVDLLGLAENLFLEGKYVNAVVVLLLASECGSSLAMYNILYILERFVFDEDIIFNDCEMDLCIGCFLNNYYIDTNNDSVPEANNNFENTNNNFEPEAENNSDNNNNNKEPEANDKETKANNNFEKTNKSCVKCGKNIYGTQNKLILKRSALIFEFNKKITDMGYKTNFVNLGDCYFYGIGCEQSYRDAYAFYLSAALKKDSVGFYSLSYLYEKGLGVEKNLIKSLWYLCMMEEKMYLMIWYLGLYKIILIVLDTIYNVLFRCDVIIGFSIVVLYFYGKRISCFLKSYSCRLNGCFMSCKEKGSVKND